MISAGLILEGGGMRGIFTAGVLDFFLEQKLDFAACYGVSAGACHAASFLAGQHGRAYRVAVDYLDEKQYCSFQSLRTTGDLFGVKMIYDTIPNELDPYDYEAFLKNKTKFYATVTNCYTGLAEYLPVRDMHRDLIAVRASASLPLLARPVGIRRQLYLDGGVADSIPLKAAMDAGYEKNVVVLTQHDGYQKKPNKAMPIIRKKYQKYPALVEALATRHERYNEALAFVGAQEKAGNAFVIRPQAPLHLGRIEKDRKKLEATYLKGYEEAKSRYLALLEFLGK